ncbi:MAG: hypothetical protein HOF76_02090 [Candidatus Scalindua sp.]|nr:hypothetical protein [Candidatus Scalindua sp.]MBT7592111.1 hypothetical protein [Candidatus Scalindua sp.]
MVQSKHDERFSSDKISVWGALVIIRRHILFGISAGSVGFFMTGMLTSGTTQEKYSFLHRLITMELYAVVYPAMLVVIIIIAVCQILISNRADLRSISLFLKEVAVQKENISSFLSIEELRSKKAEIAVEYDIRIACVGFGNYIHIQWEKLYDIYDGNIVIYRRTNGFASDRLSKTDNGMSVRDSRENVGIFEDKGNGLITGTTYYYTIVYEIDGEEKRRHFIARFQPVLEEDSTAIEEVVEKSAIEIHAEKKHIELEKKKIDAEVERIVKDRKIDDEAKDIKNVASCVKAKVIEHREQLKREDPKKTRKQLDEECKLFEKELQVRLDIMESE